MLENVVHWLVQTIDTFGYGGVVLLMAIESSFIPFPSEIVLPPAGYLAFQGKMNVVLVVLAGTFGSLIGAWINYWIGITLGRKFILKYGHYVGLNEEHYVQAEKFIAAHGAIGMFVGRLMFGIRQLISIPAGIGKMSPLSFTLYTALGSGVWAAVLTALGYYVGQNENLLHTYYSELGWGLLLVCAVLISLYVWWHKHRMKNEKFKV